MKISGGGYKVGRRCWLQEVQEDRSSIDSFHWSRGRCCVLMSMSSPIFNIYSWAQIKFAIKYAVCEIVDGLQSRMKLIFCRCVIHSFILPLYCKSAENKKKSNLKKQVGLCRVTYCIHKNGDAWWTLELSFFIYSLATSFVVVVEHIHNDWPEEKTVAFKNWTNCFRLRLWFSLSLSPFISLPVYLNTL